MTILPRAERLRDSRLIVSVGTIAWVAMVAFSIGFYVGAPSRITAIVATRVAAERRSDVVHQRERVASLIRAALGSADSAIQRKRQPANTPATAREGTSEVRVSDAGVAVEARVRLATVKGAIYNLAGEDQDHMFPSTLMGALSRIDLYVAGDRPDIEAVWLPAESIDAASSMLAAWAVSAVQQSDADNPSYPPGAVILTSFMRDLAMSGLACAYVAGFFPTMLRSWRRSS